MNQAKILLVPGVNRESWLKAESLWPPAGHTEDPEFSMFEERPHSSPLPALRMCDMYSCRRFQGVKLVCLYIALLNIPVVMNV